MFLFLFSKWILPPKFQIVDFLFYFVIFTEDFSFAFESFKRLHLSNQRATQFLDACSRSVAYMFLDLAFATAIEIRDKRKKERKWCHLYLHDEWLIFQKGNAVHLLCISHNWLPMPFVLLSFDPLHCVRIVSSSLQLFPVLSPGIGVFDDRVPFFFLFNAAKHENEYWNQSICLKLFIRLYYRAYKIQRINNKNDTNLLFLLLSISIYACCRFIWMNWFPFYDYNHKKW